MEPLLPPIERIQTGSRVPGRPIFPSTAAAQCDLARRVVIMEAATA